MTSRAKRVCLGVEFAGLEEAMVRFAAAVWAPEAELILVHAVDLPDPPEFLREAVPGQADAVDAAMAAAEQRLDALAAAYPGRIRAIVRAGRPAPILAEVSAEVGTDEIIIGEHGNRKGRLGLGSTAENLLHLAQQPVLVVRIPPSHPARTVLVAVDARGGDPVLARVAALQADGGARVVVMHVLSPGMVGRVGLISNDRATAAFERELVEGTREWLTREAASAGLDPDRTIVHVTFGKASNEILAVVERLEHPLIVMGSRGAGGLGRLMLGSVARSIAQAAACPVLIVPTAAAAAD